MKNIEEMLKEYPNINKDIMKLNRDVRTMILAGLRADGNVKAVVTSNTISDTNKISDTVGDNVAELLDHLEIISLELARSAREYKNKIIAKIDLKESVDEAFGTLTHEEKTIIRLRYWDFPEPKWHWDKIVKESYYCQSQCFEIHKRAINKMNEQIKKPS